MVGWYILRLWVLVFLEVVIFSGTASALFLGARTYHSHLTVPAARSVMPGQGPDDALAPAADLFIPPTAAGTFLGMADDLLIQRMQQAEVKSLKFNRGGSSVSFRLEFKDGSRAAFKPTQTNPQSVPRKEVASFRLNRLLGLNLVPPSTLRTISREEVLGKLSAESAFMRPRVEAETLFDGGGTLGVLSYWIPTIYNLGLDSPDGVERWTGWLTLGNPVPPDKVLLASQLSTLLVFDLLQNNSDRFSGGNLMGAPDGKTLFYMDNAFGFQTDPEGHQRCRAYLLRAQKFSRRFVTALRRLSRQDLVEVMNQEPGPVLNDAEIDALLSRKGQALRHINGLCEKHGEDRVLVFP